MRTWLHRDSSRPPRAIVAATVPETLNLFHRELIRQLQTTHDVHVVATPGEDLEQLTSAMGVHAHKLPMTREISPLRDILAWFRWILLIAQVGPNVIVTATPKASLLGQSAAAVLGIKNRLYYVGGLRLEGAKGRTRRLLVAVERFTGACATAIVLNSPSAHQKALQLSLYKPMKTSRTEPASSHGVDSSYFTPWPRDVRLREELGISPQHTTFGFVGRLTRDKGVETLIEALDRLEDKSFTVLVVGPQNESDSKGYLELLAKDQRVVCVGRQSDVRPYYSLMDCLLLPSLREGFPNVVMEASACGVPSIVSDGTGAVDSVRHGVTGWRVPVGDSAALADVMSDVLDQAPELAARGKRARQWMVDSFDPQSVVRSLLRPLHVRSPRRAPQVKHVINNLHPGGAERLVVDIATWQRSQGWDARIVTLQDAGESHIAQEAFQRGIPVEQIAGHRYSPRTWLSLYATSRSSDIVHAHLFPSVWLTALLPLGTTIATEHSPENRRQRIAAARILDQWIYSRHDAVVAISDGVKDALLTRLAGKAPRIVTISNGIDLDRFAQAREFRQGPRLELISVGTLDHRKNIQFAISAVERSSAETSLRIIGEGPDRSELERLASASGRDVRIMGHREDISEQLGLADAFISTSKYEGFGIAALEAMASGLPVIAPRIPGLKDVVGEAGLLYEPGDMSDAVAQIERLYDPALRRKLSKAAISRAQEFSIGTTANEYCRLYESLIRSTSVSNSDRRTS